MNQTRMYFPFRTRVLVQLFAGASYLQKATFLLQDGQAFVKEGSGGDNMEFARFAFETGLPKASEKSFLATVGIQYQTQPNAPWIDSQMMPSRPTSAATFTAQFIASEDHVDRDWNDCLVMFSWNSPFAGEAEVAGEDEAEGGD
jgi:hypothetical protein